MKLKPFNSIGLAEIGAAKLAMQSPLSGYLAGKERGGSHVCALEDAWEQSFHVKHAVAVNSATSGLLAAAFAIGLGPGDMFLCPSMTMSATAAAPMFTGATPVFCDVNQYTFAIDPRSIPSAKFKAIFLTHLFGLGIDEGWWKGFAEQNGAKLVVDAAQSPFAKCDDVLVGTTAHVGIFSLNYHKHIQTGEGGICVTNDDEIAVKIRMFINHAEAFEGAA